MFVAQATQATASLRLDKHGFATSAHLGRNSKSKGVGNVTSQYTHPRICSRLTFYTMSLNWLSVAPPVSKLAQYRTLSPLAGVRVSPIQLGAMSIGNKWHEVGLGSMDKEGSFKLLDAYFDLGVG